MAAQRGNRSVGVSDVGRFRENNQDAILTDDALGLWLVADGMGGHAGGARASEIARDTVRDKCKEGVGLREAVLEAHHAIRAAQQAQPDFSDMGTTIVAVIERDERYEICWVGDSRAYRYRAVDGRLEMLTRDHNVAGMLVAAGALSPDEAARHPQRHVLTDCLGLTGEHEPRIGTLEDQWGGNEWLLLCSDGLTGELDDQAIEHVLRNSDTLTAAQERLLSEALAAGAHDNVSVVLVAGPPGVADKVPPPASRWRWPFRRRSL
ncbi:MAG: serine/threonine-protein phosphatase [Wenzhouxiangella sp.]|nr:serine/threonine-protein phosphatase [Wenzhouxiangella sp.]MCH8476329.1 protein phosphatase 2C domain-containing protein [Wenzhouxiangella sp.]